MLAAPVYSMSAAQVEGMKNRVVFLRDTETVNSIDQTCMVFRT